MTTSPDPRREPNAAPTNPNLGLLLFSWLFVGVPLAWGVFQTVIKSMALFK